MQKLKFYKWSMLLMIFISTTVSAQLFPRPSGDTRTTGIFGNRNTKPVILRDGSRQWPDGTTQYPNGTTRYPDGAISYPDGSIHYPDGAVRNPDGSMRTQGQQRNNNWDRGNSHNQHTCGIPPGQAKKKYGGNARDYAKGKKHSNCNNKRDCDDDDRNARRTQQYPQTYPQYPDYPRYPQPRNPKNSGGGNGNRNPDL